ncbi:MAG: UDP-N-acetylmuramate dehydrogenase [Candidatus Levybacteria bacterium]|nr:UDP-N-acetylmuramate dehydrogenase [Candidatus Levybacteria bacterium]
MQICENFSLADVLWYKIGGKAKYFITCQNRGDILEALAFIDRVKPNRLFICGQGTNLIFSDEYFDGVVMQIVSPHPNPLPQGAREDIALVPSHLRGEGQNEGENGSCITAFAGTVLDNVIRFAFDHNLVGLEWAGGLPGTVGAGVRGNVGAYGGEIKDNLVSCEVIDYSGNKPELKTLSNTDLQFVYRGSLIKMQKKMVVVSATFGLKKSTDEEVQLAKQVYEKNKQTRRDRHPLEYPNCGSVFKNLRKHEEITAVLEVYPDLKETIENKWYGKVAVASLIERFGLKGYRVGNAQVSDKHALFIVNLGGAKSSDVLQIISDIQEKFEQTFGFQLEVEVEIV